MFGTVSKEHFVVPKAARFCVFCRQHVAAWNPYRLGVADFSPFFRRVEPIGSNVERFSCPSCESTDRERHLFLYLSRLNLLQTLSDATILHMAPERRLGALVRSCNPAAYVAGDLIPTGATIAKIDLENIPYTGAAFDVVICNHILEHVPSPVAALREVHRVLKPGGRFICQTPYASLLATTFEERRLQSDSDRLFFYGQEDHVRLFGLDLEALLTQSGFVGRFVRHEELLPDVNAELLGVNEQEPFFDFVRGQ